MAMIAIAVANLQAEEDSGMQLSAEAAYKINKKWNIGMEAEMRTRSSFRTMDRWSIGIDGTYKLSNFLKIGAGYIFLYDNNIEKINLTESGELKNWRPSYWGPRHRFNLVATGSLDWKRFTFSLRERWQITYRPEKTVDRYDFIGEEWEPKIMDTTWKHVLRSRLQIEYNIPKCKFDPYVSAEFYNSMSLEKIRFIGGVDWKISKKQSLGVFYRYQVVTENDPDPDKNIHIIGAKYKYKF